MKTGYLFSSLLLLGAAAFALAQNGPGNNAGNRPALYPAQMAPRVLLRFDADGNGELSETELEAALTHVQSRRGGPQMGGGRGQGQGGGYGRGRGMGSGAQGNNFAPRPPPGGAGAAAPCPCGPRMGRGAGMGPGAGRGPMAGGPGGRGAGQPRGPMLDPEQRATVLLNMFDADEDGTLDKAELLTAMEHMPLHRPPPPAPNSPAETE